MRIGFITANLVAEVSGYDGDDDWGRHDELTRDRFDLDRYGEWLDAAADAGFEGVSVWTAHCWYHSVDDEQLVALREAIEGRGMEVYAYAGGFGLPGDGSGERTRDDWELTYETASRLGVDHLAGGYGAPENRETVRELGAEYDVGFAYENHPEPSVAAIRDRLAGHEDHLGVALDTGWAGTQGFSAPEAARDLAADGLLTEVHLKDVAAEGSHETCTLGDGVVDVAGTVAALREVGFDGWLSIEHEPYDRDPMPEVRESYERVTDWL